MICCSITASTKEESIKDMLRVKSKADLIEVRLDCLSNLTKSNSSKIIKEIISKKPSPIIMTCRKHAEGGKFQGTEEERIKILKDCINLNADYIDVELSSGKDVIDNLIQKKGKTKIIVSYHNFKLVPENLNQIYDDIKSTNYDIIKIACMANSLKDNLIILDLIKKAKEEEIDIIAICMGEKGEISRILNLAYGSFLTFGFLDKSKESAPGQVSCEHLRYVYRADKLDANTRIYGLIGNPVSKSKGFIVHNLSFKEQDINSVYINFLVDNLTKFIDSFKPLLSGMSITMPFKQEIIKYLDRIDPIAKKIGAVNTIVINDGKLTGYNTDVFGAICAIREKIEICGKNTVLLGAGGAAKAIGYGIIEKKGNLIISNRTTEKGKKLANELNAKFKSINEIEWNNIDILINATSVGMVPNTNESPLDYKYLKYLKNKVVFDSVYNPIITKLLNIAEKNKCKTISGIKMFVNQAAKQFELWTEKQPDKKFMEQNILEYVTS